MQAPFYLAFGSVVAEDGTGTLAYHVTSMQLPEPAEDGLGGFHPAVRVFGVRVSGADTATVTAAVAALRRECVRDNLITLQSASDRAILTTRIRKAAVVESEFDPLDRPSSGAAKMYLTLTLTTDPHWLAPWSAETTASLTAVPGTFAIADPGGEDDALVSMRAIASATARGLFLGAMPDAATGFDPIDDYGASGAGTADANALTGYKVASSALTATMAAVGTAPAFETNANRGTYIPIVRMDSNAASVATTAYRVVQRVTGNAISASTDVATASVTPRAVDLVATELERISVPSGAVPDVATGSGWSAEDALLTQADASGSLLVNAGRGATGDLNGYLYFYQTYTTAVSVMLTAFEFTVVTAPTTTTGWELQVIRVSDWTVLRTSTVASMATGVHKVAFTELETADGDVYQLRVTAPGAAGFNDESCVIDSSASSVYADGVAGESFSGDSTKDLTCKVYGKTELGFNSYSIVQATDSADAFKIANLDYLVRVPVDYAALAYRLATSAAPGLYYDGDTDVAYIADADGIGPAVLDKAEVIKPLRAKPGVSTTYVLATTHDDVAVGTASVTYKTRARYLSATG